MLLFVPGASQYLAITHCLLHTEKGTPDPETSTEQL